MKAATMVCAAVLLLNGAARAGVEEDVAQVRQEWERIKYQVPAKQQEPELERLAKTSEKLVTQYPKRAEPAIWHGIIEASYAGAKGGVGALTLARSARRSLEHALAIDPS